MRARRPALGAAAHARHPAAGAGGSSPISAATRSSIWRAGLASTSTNRHSALADAIVTGKIFLALLPKLREGNIRTLAEAEQACLTLTGVLEDQHRAGWEEAVKGPRAREERTFARIDPYPYRHRVADVMSAPPKTVAANVSLADALQRMARDKISSLLVAPPASARSCVRTIPPSSPSVMYCVLWPRTARRAIATGRAVRQQAPDRRARRCVCLSRARPHEPPQAAAPRGGKRER